MSYLTTENLERLLAVIGAVGAAASLLAAVLPASWRLTRGLARFSADVRGIHKPSLPPPPADKAQP